MNLSAQPSPITTRFEQSDTTVKDQSEWTYFRALLLQYHCSSSLTIDQSLPPKPSSVLSVPLLVPLTLSPTRAVTKAWPLPSSQVRLLVPSHVVVLHYWLEIQTPSLLDHKTARISSPAWRSRVVKPTKTSLLNSSGKIVRTRLRADP